MVAFLPVGDVCRIALQVPGNHEWASRESSAQRSFPQGQKSTAPDYRSGDFLKKKEIHSVFKHVFVFSSSSRHGQTPRQMLLALKIATRYIVSLSSLERDIQRDRSRDKWCSVGGHLVSNTSDLWKGERVSDEAPHRSPHGRTRRNGGSVRNLE